MDGRTHNAPGKTENGIRFDRPSCCAGLNLRHAPETYRGPKIVLLPKKPFRESPFYETDLHIDNHFRSFFQDANHHEVDTHPYYCMGHKEKCFKVVTEELAQESLPVSLFLSPEFLGLSSSSDHLSPSSPTAKIVSPSSDSRGRGDGFGGGFGDKPRSVVPLGTGVRSSVVLPSSSSRESASERISKPSSSCAN